MVRKHSISAPDETWQQVIDYANQKETSISNVTRQAWAKFFDENKNYRLIDLIIILLLSVLCVFFIMGVWIL